MFLNSIFIILIFSNAFQLNDKEQELSKEKDALVQRLTVQRQQTKQRESEWGERLSKSDLEKRTLEQEVSDLKTKISNLEKKAREDDLKSKKRQDQLCIELTQVKTKLGIISFLKFYIISTREDVFTNAN